MRKFLFKPNEKITAVILVLMLIFSSASAGLTAAAEDESSNYTVSYASPAIPMDANTFVRLDSIEFATQSGDVISGSNATLTLTGESNDVVVSNGVITAYAKGVYPATVTDGTNSMSVYVVVKNPAENAWYIYDADYTIGNYNPSGYGVTALPTDWVGQYADNVYTTTFAGEYTHVAPYNTTNNVTSGVIPVYNKYEEDGSSYSLYAYYTLNDEVVNSFADYTINADTISYNHFDHIRSGVGLYGRVELSGGKIAQMSGANDRFSVFFTSNYGDKSGAAGANTGIKMGIIGDGAYWQKLPSGVTAVQGIELSTVNSNIGKELNMSLKYEGGTATYKVGTTTYQYNLANDASKDSNYLASGAVGVFVGYAGDKSNYGTTWAAIQRFSVALNNSASDKPVSYSITESDDGIEKYMVDLNRAPAIPMISGTVVQLKHINFSLGNTIVNGSQTNLISMNDEIIVADGKITALSTGVYPLSVTIGSNTVTAYAVVKDTTDDKWYLYNEDFTDDYDEYTMGPKNEFPTNWKAQVLTAYGYNNGFKEYPYMSYYNAQNVYLDSQSDPMVGAFPFTDPYDYGWNNDNTHIARGYFTFLRQPLCGWN